MFHAIGRCPKLTVGGLELEPDLARRAADPDAGWGVGAAEAERAAASLGYAARITDRLANLLDVPLRYPIGFGGSRSSIATAPLPAGDLGCVRWKCLSHCDKIFLLANPTHAARRYSAVHPPEAGFG